MSHGNDAFAHMTYGQAMELLETYGSPLYLVDGDRFSDTFRRLSASMGEAYRPYRAAYSMKTNYMPYLCDLVKRENGMIEVVSSMEYETAEAIGFDPPSILFNGPFKEPWVLERAFLGGSTVVLDNDRELEDVLSFAAAHPGTVPHVGLRANFDMGTAKGISRFGFDARSGSLDRAAASLREAGVPIDGLHCHFTGARSLEKWAYRSVQMIELADRVFGASPPRFIDLGSGMYGEMEPALECQFGDGLPSFEDYSKTVGGIFDRRYGQLPECERPVLITEPGTTLAANALSCLSTVWATKTVRGKAFAILDTSSHVLGELSLKKNLPIAVLRSDKKPLDVVSGADFVGYTCLEYDCFYRGYAGEIGRGDAVLFGNVGSYSNDMKPPFILPGCAAVAFDHAHPGGLHVKRRETASDVFETYAMPE